MNGKVRSFFYRERNGSVLLYLVAALAILSVLGLVLLTGFGPAILTTARPDLVDQALYAAEAGVRVGLARRALGPGPDTVSAEYSIDVPSGQTLRFQVGYHALWMSNGTDMGGQTYRYTPADGNLTSPFPDLVGAFLVRSSRIVSGKTPEQNTTSQDYARITGTAVSWSNNRLDFTVQSSLDNFQPDEGMVLGFSPVAGSQTLSPGGNLTISPLAAPFAAADNGGFMLRGVDYFYDTAQVDLNGVALSGVRHAVFGNDFSALTDVTGADLVVFARRDADQDNVEVRPYRMSATGIASVDGNLVANATVGVPLAVIRSALHAGAGRPPGEEIYGSPQGAYQGITIDGRRLAPGEEGVSVTLDGQRVGIPFVVARYADNFREADRNCSNATQAAICSGLNCTQQTSSCVEEESKRELAVQAQNVTAGGTVIFLRCCDTIWPDNATVPFTLHVEVNGTQNAPEDQVTWFVDNGLDDTTVLYRFSQPALNSTSRFIGNFFILTERPTTFGTISVQDIQAVFTSPEGVEQNVSTPISLNYPGAETGERYLLFQRATPSVELTVYGNATFSGTGSSTNSSLGLSIFFTLFDVQMNSEP